MTTKLEYTFSVLSLLTYLINNTFDIFICVVLGENDNAHELVLIRIKTEIGLAYFTSLLAQFSFIIDLQTRAIQQKAEQIEQNQQEQQQESGIQSMINQERQEISKTLKQFENSGQSYTVRSMDSINKIILFISIVSFFIASTLMNLLITVQVLNISTFFVVCQGFFLIFAIISKILLQRRHMKIVFIHCQRNFVVSYFLTFVNIYWFYKLAIEANFSVGIAVAIGFNYFLKMFYYSLLSCSKSISRVQLVFSLITLIYYTFNYSHTIVMTIYENQPNDSDFFIRVKTQIGIALMTSLTAQYTIIMDVQMEAMKEYRQKQNNIENIIKNKQKTIKNNKILQIQLIKYQVQQTERENKQILLQKFKNQKIQKYLLDAQDQIKDDNQDQEKIDSKINRLQRQILQHSKIKSFVQSKLEENKFKCQSAISQIKKNNSNEKQKFLNFNLNLKRLFKYLYFRSYKNNLDKILCLITVSSFFISSVVLNIVQHNTSPLQGHPYFWILHIQSILCLIFIVSKFWLLLRKNNQHYYLKAQKQYFVVYLLSTLLLYLLLEDIKVSTPMFATQLSVKDYIGIISSNLYISFLCIPQTTSRIQFCTVFASLAYQFYYTAIETAYVIIYFQAFEQYYLFRRFLYIILAIFVLSLSITCLQMDYLIKAIRKHYKNQIQIDQIFEEKK